MIDISFLPSLVIPKVFPEMKLSFKPRLLGSWFLLLSLVFSSAPKFSRNSVFSSSDLALCSTSIAASLRWTFCRAVRSAQTKSSLSALAGTISRLEAIASSDKVFTLLIMKVPCGTSFLSDSARSLGVLDWPLLLKRLFVARMLRLLCYFILKLSTITFELPFQITKETSLSIFHYKSSNILLVILLSCLHVVKEKPTVRFHVLFISWTGWDVMLQRTTVSAWPLCVYVITRFMPSGTCDGNHFTVIAVNAVATLNPRLYEQIFTRFHSQNIEREHGVGRQGKADGQPEFRGCG